MPIVLDTSLLVAYVNTEDPDHARAKRVMRRVLAGEIGTPVGPDYVLDEGLAVIQRRTGRIEDARAFASYFHPIEGVDGGPILQPVRVPEPVVGRARDLFFDRFDRHLSFTDCVVVCLARQLEGSVGAIEGGFDGLVPTVTG